MIPAVFLAFIVGIWAIWQYVSLFHKYTVLKSKCEKCNCSKSNEPTEA